MCLFPLVHVRFAKKEKPDGAQLCLCHTHLSTRLGFATLTSGLTSSPPPPPAPPMPGVGQSAAGRGVEGEAGPNAGHTISRFPLVISAPALNPGSH